MARFPAFFDTNALFGFHLNDLILGLAEQGLFRPLWSGEVLEELQRNLTMHGIEHDRATRRLNAMRAAFPDACVRGYESLIPSLTCDEKDRHVLAAAVHGGAEVLVSFNLSDFPPSSVVAHDIEVVHPDAFLLDQLDLYPGPTLNVAEQLVADYSHPEITIDDLLLRFARAGVPEFASALRRHT